MEEKAKRKGLPVSRFAVFYSLPMLLLLAGVLLMLTVLITGNVPLSDSVIFPLLFTQYRAWAIVVGCLITPILVGLVWTWLKHVYRMWDGLTLTFYPRAVVTTLWMICVPLLVLFGCTFMVFGDSIEIRGRIVQNHHMYFVVKFYGYDDLGYGPHLLYECDEQGVVCQRIAEMETRGYEFIKMSSDSQAVQIVFEGHNGDKTYFYPLE